MATDADYGVLKDVVAIAGSLIAASTAIRLAWMRRAKWMPPNETVQGAVAKYSSVTCAVIIGLLFLVRNEISLGVTVKIAIGCLIGALVCLVISIYTNTTFAYIRKPHIVGIKEPDMRILGEHALTEEAAAKRKSKNPPTVQQLYDMSNDQAERVWTKSSMALVQIVSTVGFIGLQVSGSVALAATAIAFSLAK